MLISFSCPLTSAKGLESLACKMQSTKRMKDCWPSLRILEAGMRSTTNSFHCVGPIPVVKAVLFTNQVTRVPFRIAQRYFRKLPVMINPLSFEYISESESSDLP